MIFFNYCYCNPIASNDDDVPHMWIQTLKKTQDQVFLN